MPIKPSRHSHPGGTQIPLHSFVAANTAAVAERRKDPLQFKITESEAPFTCNYKIDFLTFVRTILFLEGTMDPVTGQHAAKDMRPMAECIHDCLIEADKERFVLALDRSIKGDDADYIAPETINDVHTLIIAYYRGDRPLADADSSAATPSTDGTNSTASSSTPASDPAAARLQME